ncbi:transmembrane-type terpene cyclase [Hespellia stercorisuis]
MSTFQRRNFMTIFLTLLSGIGWMIVYEECIRLGIKQKTYAMPFWALALNLTWEAIYSYSDIFLGAHGPLEGITIAQAVVNVFWVCLDCVILYTYFKYGKKEWPQKISGKLFVPWSLLVLVCSAVLQLAFIKEFGFFLAAEYSAFLQNLLMSVLFIHLFISRKSMEGQSLLLAVAKWIGTLAPTILMGVIQFNIVVLTVGLFCSVFDIIYIILLLKERKVCHE